MFFNIFFIFFLKISFRWFKFFSFKSQNDLLKWWIDSKYMYVVHVGDGKD